MRHKGIWDELAKCGQMGGRTLIHFALRAERRARHHQLVMKYFDVRHSLGATEQMKISHNLTQPNTRCQFICDI